MHGFIRNAGSILACCVLAAASTVGHSQAAPAKPAVGTVMTPAATYGKLLGMLEKEFVDAVEAMPEDKFNFAPTTGEFKGVRSFGAQVKHVASANWYFFGGSDMTEEKVKAKGDAIEKLTTKAEIVQALKDSLSQAHSLHRRHYRRERLRDDRTRHPGRYGLLRHRPHDGPLRPARGLPAHERYRTPGQPRLDVRTETGMGTPGGSTVEFRPSIWNSGFGILSLRSAFRKVLRVFR